MFSYSENKVPEYFWIYDPKWKEPPSPSNYIDLLAKCQKYVWSITDLGKKPKHDINSNSSLQSKLEAVKKEKYTEK